MKILIVHNRYRQAGGEDHVFERERALLLNAGHEVLVYSRSNDEIDSGRLVETIRPAANAIWSVECGRHVAALLRTEKPDVVHVHNTFHVISPSIYRACRRAGVPVVQTLHNFRLLCPAASLFRNDRPCEECVEHSLWRGIVHGCYHGSRAQTAVLAAAIKAHRLSGGLDGLADIYIALTESSRRTFVRMGFPESRVVVKPNFVVEDPGERTGEGDYALYLGRISHEKGADILFEAWRSMPAGAHLRYAGDGPLLSSLRQQTTTLPHGNVGFEGHRSYKQVLDLLRGARFLVVPSAWPEQFGLVVIEAFACGVPVISSDRQSLTDLVSHGRSGLIFRSGDCADLQEKLRFAWSHPEYMRGLGRSARREYLDKYTAERNLAILIDIYQHAISRHCRAAAA